MLRVILVENLILLNQLLQKNEDVLYSFDSLLVASKFMGYKIQVKKLDHKKNVYYAATFKNKDKDKEVHLDFSFNDVGELLSVCTCNGDCKPLHFSSDEDKFIKTIECFRDLLSK